MNDTWVLGRYCGDVPVENSFTRLVRRVTVDLDGTWKHRLRTKELQQQKNDPWTPYVQRLFTRSASKTFTRVRSERWTEQAAWKNDVTRLTTAENTKFAAKVHDVVSNTHRNVRYNLLTHRRHLGLLVEARHAHGDHHVAQLDVVELALVLSRHGGTAAGLLRRPEGQEERDGLLVVGLHLHGTHVRASVRQQLRSKVPVQLCAFKYSWSSADTVAPQPAFSDRHRPSVTARATGAGARGPLPRR